jgi:hypothetical protein
MEVLEDAQGPAPVKLSLAEIINTDLRRLLRWVTKGVDVDIPFNAIESVLLISEDILGPIHRSLVVKLETGRKRKFEDDYEIGKFAEHIRVESPELADRIREELAVQRGFPCWQVLVYQKDVCDPS